MRTFLLAVLAACAAAQMPGEEAAKENTRPMSRIVNMLKDMHAELNHEQEKDEKLHAKFMCWCDENKRIKENDTKNNEVAESQLVAEEKKQGATAARLGVEINNLRDDLKNNQDSLAKAISIRDKDRAQFNADQKDDLVTISSLKSAITALKKHHELLQTDQEQVLRHVALLVQYTAHRRSMNFSPKQHAAVQSLVQGTYQPASGEIFGIIKNMKENFEANNEQATQEEKNAEAEHEDMVAAKQEEMAEQQRSIDEKSSAKGDAEMAAAGAKEDLENTRETLASDRSFVEDLVTRCDANDKNFGKRTEDRADEINAVTKAIEILSSDSATSTFERSVPKSAAPTGFIQVSARQERAAAVLAKHPALSTLAMHIRLDSFEKVKDSIDAMIKEQTQQQKDEVKKRDFCNSEFNKNGDETATATRNQNDQANNIEAATATIKMLSEEIANLEKNIANTAEEMKRAGENRERDNAEFHAIIADQRNTQRLIEKAIKFLAAVYEKDAKNRALLISSRAVSSKFAGIQQPEDFGGYEKKESGANAVLQLLRKELNLSKRMEAEETDAETQDQRDYETFVQESNISVEDNTATKVNKESKRADAESAKHDAEVEHQNQTGELEILANTAAALHESCDFTLNNFTKRQEARAAEMESLRQAKAILSGSDFSASFLQRRI